MRFDNEGVTPMKRVRYILLVAALAVLAAVPHVSAQQNGATRVQADATMLNACTPLNATGAVNATATLTIPAPPSGLYVYVCGIDIAISFDATGGTASTNVTFTSTNFGSWLWKMSWAGTASTTITQPFYWAQPLKSPSAGTAITIVSPAANLHGAYSINGYYYYAP
jgi:hypothetical protein